jgi:hypothetical protein
MASILGPLAVGIAWMILGSLVFSVEAGTTGLTSGIIVAAASLVADLLIQPWKNRTVIAWMTLWIVHSALRVGLSLGLLILLYFAFSPDPTTLLFSYLLSFLVGLVWETKVWTGQMRHLGSPEPQDHGAE